MCRYYLELWSQESTNARKALDIRQDKIKTQWVTCKMDASVGPSEYTELIPLLHSFEFIIPQYY